MVSNIQPPSYPLLLSALHTFAGCSADGWWGAVRHVGTVFGLAPNEDAFDSFGLPFPDLGVTISQIQVWLASILALCDSSHSSFVLCSMSMNRCV
jgi:hypothetical protein